MDLQQSIYVRKLGRKSYFPVWQAMQRFTDQRDQLTADEIWFVEHDAVFTQGQAGKPEHLLSPAEIPVIQVDRGGQVTYHGPGQLVAYLLIDIRRKGIGVRQLVSAIENSIVELMQDYSVKASPRADAPGVYVNGAKLCSLGLRIRKGCSFHGLALNVSMDMEPFSRINPCGLEGISITQTADLGGPNSLTEIQPALLAKLITNLDYSNQISDQQREQSNLFHYPFESPEPFESLEELASSA